MQIARKFAAQLRIVPEEIGYLANSISHSTVSLCNHKSPELICIWNRSIGAAPIVSVGLRLSDEATRIAVAHRLGCRACEPHICVCGKTVDARGLHVYLAAEVLPDNSDTVR